MSEPIQGLWAVYLTEYPDDGSALIEAEDAQTAIRRSLEWDWGSEPFDALTAEAMTPEAMIARFAREAPDWMDAPDAAWLANVACGQELEIERLRAEVRRLSSLDAGEGCQ